MTFHIIYFPDMFTTNSVNLLESNTLPAVIFSCTFTITVLSFLSPSSANPPHRTVSCLLFPHLLALLSRPPSKQYRLCHSLLFHLRLHCVFSTLYFPLYIPPFPNLFSFIFLLFSHDCPSLYLSSYSLHSSLPPHVSFCLAPWYR